MTGEGGEGLKKIVVCITRRILGLHLPKMKQVVKALAKQADVLEVLHAFEQEHQANRSGLAYEKTLVWGLTINALKCTPDEQLNLLQKYILAPGIWAVWDSFCCNAKWALKIPPQTLWKFLLPYYHSDKEFEVRFAIAMSMYYLLKEEWLSIIFQQLDELELSNIHSEYTSLTSPYYVRMAMAWLLATSLAKFPEETRSFVNSSSFTEDVKRLYARKARESFWTRHIVTF